MYVTPLKPTMWPVFHVMFYVLHLRILNLIIVSKSNLQWSCLPVFSYLLLQTIYVGMTFDGKVKIYLPRWSVWNALILWNSKNTLFCVCENKFYIVATIMTKLAVLILPFCYLTSPKLSKYPLLICIIEEIFVREQFHKFLELFAKVY